jgi:hypothetical protein
MAIRSKTYAELLERYQRLTGSDLLTTQDEAFANAFIGRNLRWAWESYEWPSVCLVEERTPDANNLISYTQSGETAIGEVFACYRDDPYGNASARQVGYILTADGIQFQADNAYDPTYVYFRKRIPEFSGNAYASGTAYTAGDVVYYATTGDYYTALQSTTGNLPTNASYWERNLIPYELFEYAAQAAYGDWLISNDQAATGMAMRGLAGEALMQEFDKLSRQQGFKPMRRTFYTHGTQQLRQ